MFKDCKHIFRVCLMALFAVAVTISAATVYAQDVRADVKAGLSSRDWQVRLSAVEKMENMKDEQSLAVLREVAGTRTEYWPVKIKAILLLGEAQDPKAVDLLLTTFNDTFSNWECPSIKSYTAVALGNFKGNAKVVDALIGGINDRELLTREACIKSLGRIGDAKAVPHLVGLLGDRSTAIRLSAVKALADIGDAQAVSSLKRMAESDGDSVVKSEALTALRSFEKGTAN